MTKKYTEIEKGKFQKLGKEYDYVIEAGQEFNGNKDLRVRIVQERPIIRKVRTRYDPEIQLFGDKNATMNVSLGYNMKEINFAIRSLYHSILIPFYATGILGFYFLLIYVPATTEKGFLPDWSLWVLFPLLAVLIVFFFKIYFKNVMGALAEYFKAKDLKRLLNKEGYRK